MAENVNTFIYDRQVNRAAMIRLYEKRVTGKIEVIFDGHSIRLDNLIKKSGNKKEFTDLLDKEISKTYKEAYNTSSRSLLDLASDQLSYTTQTLQQAVSDIWDVRKPQRRISEEIVLRNPLYKNTTLNTGWGGIAITEKKRIESMIRSGLDKGQTVDEIATTVRKSNILDISRNNARALVITGITSVHAQVDQEVYLANEKALQGWQYVAVLDSRTTALCAERDGNIYPISDFAHLPPAHYRCRSTTLPVVKSWDDLGKLEGVSQIRRRNLQNLTPKQVQYYDGLTPLKESYNACLS